MSGTTRSSPFPAPREGADNPTIPPPAALTQTGDLTDLYQLESDSLWPTDTELESATSRWAFVDSANTSLSHTSPSDTSLSDTSLSDTSLSDTSVSHTSPSDTSLSDTSAKVTDLDGASAKHEPPEAPTRIHARSAESQRRGPTRTGSRRAVRIFLILTVVTGALSYVASKRPWTTFSDSVNSESATVASTGPSWIASGKYRLPDDIEPGLYRVGREYTIYDQDDKVVRKSPATSEGTTLLAIPENELDGSIEITGGAWPLKDDGPVDPTRFRAGTYLVNFDVQPGTYQVTPVPRGDGIASATRLDGNNEIIQVEQVDESDPTDSVIIVVEPTDFGFSFVGELEKID